MTASSKDRGKERYQFFDPKILAIQDHNQGEEILATQGYIRGKEYCQLAFKELGVFRYKGSYTKEKSGWDRGASYGNPWKSCWDWLGRSRNIVFQAAMYWYVVSPHVLKRRL